MTSYRRADIEGLSSGAQHGGDFTLPGYTLHYAPDLGLQPDHLELHLGVDLESRSATGMAIWTIDARRAGQRHLELDAVGFDVEDVRDADGHALSWRHDGEKLLVDWAAAAAKGERRRLVIEWHVSRPMSGMFFGGAADGSDPRTTWMATDHETERARYWLPCVDHPNVRTTMDIHLRGSEAYARVATGYLVDESSNGDGTVTSHWRLEQRCPSYLLCLLVGEFAEADGGEHAGVPIRFYAPAPYTSADLERSFGPTAEMMKWMTERLGVAFPFPKYYQFAAPGVGGAMENISLTSWDDAFVADETFHGERGWLIDLINLHEMAHSYFGDAVVCRDFAHAWLKEGWATYMESVWLGDTVGTDALHYQMYDERRAYRQEADNRYQRPIMTRAFNSSFQVYDGHLYPGAAWRIHMLRHQLGEDDFWTAVRSYLERYSGHVVETDDFRHELEKVSGRSLAKFFDQWICSAGYPKLKASHSFDGDKGRSTVVVEQTQKSKAGESPEIGYFDFELEIGLRDADGNWTTHVLAMDGGRHTLVIPVEAAPTAVVIDPDMKLMHSLDFNPGEDLLIAALKAPTINGRIHAIETLTKAGGRRGVQAVIDAYAEETHFGVRIVMGRSLGAAGTLVAAEGLSKLLLEEAEPRVMQTLTAACGEYRQGSVAQALTEWLAQPGRPYLAKGAALRSLGAQRGEEQLEQIASYADEMSWWGWVRREAHVALGKTRTRAGFEMLLERVRRGGDVPQVGMMTTVALAESTRWLDETARSQAREAIIDATEGQGVRFCMTAASALVTIGDPQGAAHIDRMGARLAPQWRPGFRKMSGALAKRGQGGPDAALQKTVEELAQTVQKLTARIEDMEAARSAESSD